MLSDQAAYQHTGCGCLSSYLTTNKNNVRWRQSDAELLSTHWQNSILKETVPREVRFMLDVWHQQHTWVGWKNKLHFELRRASVAPRMTTIQRLFIEGAECDESKTQPEPSCLWRIQRETNFSKVINFGQRYQDSGVRPYLDKIRRNAAYSSVYFSPHPCNGHTKCHVRSVASSLASFIWYVPERRAHEF